MNASDILVIGGGATGLGVAWDAALRGYRVRLVEKGDLAHGTTGRYHGLLHSGGRYAVRDPRSAADCWRENQVLRRILPSAIEDTGGLFVALPDDPPDYEPQFIAGCRAAGIPLEAVPRAAALRLEPLLNPALVRAWRVPDAACDSFDATHALARAVQDAGGEVWLRWRVTRLLVANGRVTGAEVESVATGERATLGADLVINCAGAWAGQVAALAGCPVGVVPGKGTMLAMNTRLVNTILNRLKPPGDGDILVPVGTVAVIGTTEVRVADPDQYAIEPWEVELLLAEGEKLLPRFREFRPLRAWAGVRPLVDVAPAGQPAAAGSRELSRAHAVLDHAARDGVEGLVSVVGGKFTTFRLMAEEAVDLAGRKLGSPRPCRTADTPIDPPGRAYHHLQNRLARSEAPVRPELICECELVTRDDVESALRASGSLVLNDLRRDLRLGMGPCQAGFCAYRAAGIASAVMAAPPSPPLPEPDSPPRAEAGPPVQAINSALAEFLQERWKGLRPVMWGANLRQLELDQLIYREILGVERLPLARAPEVYPTERSA